MWLGRTGEIVIRRDIHICQMTVGRGWTSLERKHKYQRHQHHQFVLLFIVYVNRRWISPGIIEDTFVDVLVGVAPS